MNLVPRFLPRLVGALLCGLVAVALPGTPQSSGAEKALREMLKRQAEDWNRGDVEAFMQSYWRSPELTFAGSGGVERGWENVLARYKRVYPDRSAMGLLTFSRLEITFLSDEAALILGHWQLQREKDNPGGIFTLVVRRFPEGWRIIHDHTSVVLSQQK